MTSLISVAAIAALAGAASADVLTSERPFYDVKTETTASELTGSSARAGFTRDVSLVDVASWDTFGDSSNVVMLIDMAALFGLSSGSAIDLNGIAWDVTINTVGASWLSEARMEITDQAISAGLGLTVGIGNDFAGTGTFTSAGVLKLQDAGLPDLILADGILRLEFWETFDDVADEIDAFLNGTLTLQSSVPAPSGVALLGLGGLVAARRRR